MVEKQEVLSLFEKSQQTDDYKQFLENLMDKKNSVLKDFKDMVVD